MEKTILETFMKIRDMEMVNLDGRMDVSMKEHGLKENSMELDYIEMLEEKNVEANGMMGKGLVG